LVDKIRHLDSLILVDKISGLIVVFPLVLAPPPSGTPVRGLRSQ